MRSKIIALLSILMLFSASGCFIPAYTIPRDERSVGDIMDDTIVRSDIKSILMRQDPEQGYATNVYSYNGHVYLVGAVTEVFRVFAEREAKNVKDVKSVTTIWYGPDVNNDTALGLSVRTALVENSNLSSTQIDLQVYGAEVVLLGLVRDHNDVNIAMATAKSVDGVKHVRSYLVPTK